MLRVGSLFSGAGGLDMAVEQFFGGRTVWHCELDAAASKVLAHRWPGVPNHGDITAVDWSTVEAIDILCGGFPCQDISSAGRQAGMGAGTRSGLWSEFARAIAALRPRLVVIENVRNLLSADGEAWPAEVVAADAEWARLARVVALIHSKINRAMREDWWHGQYKQRKQFELHRMARLRDRALARFRTLKRRLVQRAIGTVVADLANLGYDAQWTTISAASVGAPHKRERVIILAVDADSTRVRGADIARSGDTAGQHVVAVAGAGDRDRSREAAAGIRDMGAAAAELAAVDLLATPCAARSGNNQSASPGAAVRPSLDSITDLLPTPRRSDGDGGANPLSRAERMDDVETRVIRLLQTPRAADGDGSRKARGGDRGNEPLLPGQAVEMAQQWGKYAPAIKRWEAVTRPAPSPTEPNTFGNPRLAAHFPEWMMGWPAGWVTDVPGVSRNDALRIIGNGVCPQQAIAALRWLLPVSAVAA
ncbi:DNA cytosine methyltransferase [Mycobacterium dioxanotrophicus]|uniref:DNA cytosine methyltransferase n=1 Tax=Mycobacterium dioxanotrophicus TaxID=482462 RepID=UPI0018E00856|nr:DNA cytosine methyltransferase [Mycobacterium dioxanotrophicus]